MLSQKQLNKLSVFTQLYILTARWSKHPRNGNGRESKYEQNQLKFVSLGIIRKAYKQQLKVGWYKFRNVCFQLIIIINQNNDRHRYLNKMLKASSLNKIYQTPSSDPNQTLLSLKNITNPYTLVHDHEGNMLRKYELSSAYLQKDSHLFQWRKRIHHPIPKIFRINNHSDMNQKNFVSIFCQHINTNFTQLPLFKVQQIIYCLSQMLLGYQQIFARLGFACIQTRFIGLNTRGELLIWISQNLLSNVAQFRKQLTERQIVTKIIQILQTKALSRNDIFFSQLRKLQPKFKVILQFIMTFKNRNKLKIIPKILFGNKQIVTVKMITSNTFSGKSHNQPMKSVNNGRDLMIRTIGQIKSSRSQSQIMTENKFKANRFQVVRRNPNVRTSIMQCNQNNTPINKTSVIHQKSGPKINFTYSQKRQDLYTPKQSAFFRDYTSDKNQAFFSGIYSESNQIQQFTLGDRKPNVQGSQKPRIKVKYQRKIVASYSIYYVPQNDTTYMQTELDLKRSSNSHYSQSSFSEKGRDTDYKKTSMTTNHRSAITQSFQSLGKSSNDEQYYEKKNNLFTSNNSNRTTYSIIRNSFVENQAGKDRGSFVMGPYHERYQKNPLEQPQQKSDNSQGYGKRKQMYTFGGLITTAEEVQQFSRSKQQPPNLSPPRQIKGRDLPKASLNNQINTKSIQQLYNNLYFNSQKKSMIIDQGNYQIKLSPVKQQNQADSSVNSHVKKSFAIEVIAQHEPISHNKLLGQKQHSLFQTFSGNDSPAFDYNQWRGIKGLLSQSNCNQLKQSIHCGPQIRTPLNIKLQLLDKFGRDIGQSILPLTPSISHHSKANSFYNGNGNENSFQFY